MQVVEMEESSEVRLKGGEVEVRASVPMSGLGEGGGVSESKASRGFRASFHIPA